MSKIKKMAEDKFGDDWVHVIEDMEKENARRKK